MRVVPAGVLIGAVLIGAAGALLLAGCGQKGPLYLPEKKQGTVVTPSPAATPPTSSASGAAQPAQPATAAPKKNDKDQETPQPQ